MPGQITAKNLTTRQVFITFAKIEIFQQVDHFFHSFIKYYTFLSKITECLGKIYLPRPDAWA